MIVYTKVVWFDTLIPSEVYSDVDDQNVNNYTYFSNDYNYEVFSKNCTLSIDCYLQLLCKH